MQPNYNNNNQKKWIRPMQETQETWVWSLRQEDPPEEGMVTHPSIPAWRIPWIDQPGGLQSTELQSRTRLKRLSMRRSAGREEEKWRVKAWRNIVGVGSFPENGSSERERDIDRNCGRVSLWRVQCNHPPNPRNIQEKYGWNGFVSKS